MFNIPPPAGGPRRRYGLGSGREKIQLLAMAAIVLAIFGWWGTRSARKGARGGGGGPGESHLIKDIMEDMAQEQQKSVIDRERVKDLRDKEQQRPARPREERKPGSEANPGFGVWRDRTPEEISPEDKQWLLEADRAEETERAKFLPMLEEFRALEPDAVRAYRTRIMDRVPVRAKTGFVLPDEPGVEYVVVKADGAGLTARRAGGPERTFSWGEVPVESLYAMAEQIAVVEEPRASVKDIFFLAQLATLAGKPDEAARYRNRTVELDPQLDGRVPKEPATSLDYGILDLYSWSWDTTDRSRSTPREASSVRGDAPSIFHVYRYLRTLGPEGLAPLVEPPTRYELLQGLPVNHRGRVYTVRGRFIKRYKSTRWTRIEGHEEAGIQDVDFCFIRGARWSGIYLVSVPKDTRGFTSSDMVTFTGVYIRRWPYLSDGEWKWIPWIAALELEKVEIGQSQGMRILGIGILAVAVFGTIGIFIYARHESRQTAAARERRVARQRAQRDRVRRKAAEAPKGEGEAEKKAGQEGADAGGDPGKS